MRGGSGSVCQFLSAGARRSAHAERAAPPTPGALLLTSSLYGVRSCKMLVKSLKAAASEGWRTDAGMGASDDEAGKVLDLRAKDTLASTQRLSVFWL